MSISSTKYRVGLPPVRPLPLKNSYDVTDVCSPGGLDNLYAKVADILTSHNVRRPESRPRAHPWDSNRGFDTSIRLVHRSIPEVPDSDRLTLLITAYWTDSSAEDWPLAVQDIRPLVLQCLDQQEVDVEMIATYLTTPREIGPVGHHPLIQDKWDTISGGIKEVLQSHPESRDNVTAITVFRMGYHRNIQENPITVYVSVSYDCPEASWAPIIDDINKILEPYPLELFFEHNYWKPATIELVPPSSLDKTFNKEYTRRPYQECPDLGADIGAAQYIKHDGGKMSPAMGTLGCYVQFTTKRGAWERMALTNYHVCRPCIPGFTARRGKRCLAEGTPLSGSLLMKTDRSGIGPKHEAALSNMEHPSRARHNVKLAEFHASLENNPNNDHVRSIVERGLKTCQRAFHKDANILGKVWAASGFDRRSTATNSFLDWALFEVEEDRHGNNVLPNFPTLENTHNLGNSPHAEGVKELKMYRDDTTLEKLKPGARVFKYGAATGLTVGHYQNLMAYAGIPFETADPTTSLTTASVIERAGDRQFAAPGDSGAVVYGMEGHALGMVFGTLHPSVAKGEPYLTWVMAMDQIFEDIKAYCGVTDVRIADCIMIGEPLVLYD